MIQKFSNQLFGTLFTFLRQGGVHVRETSLVCQTGMGVLRKHPGEFLSSVLGGYSGAAVFGSSFHVKNLTFCV